MALIENRIYPGQRVSFIAGAAIGKNDCVKLDTTEGQVIKTSAANDAGIGFAEDAAASGAGVTVVISGIVWARCSAAIALGVEVEATADGEVVTETPANGVDQQIVGKAIGATDAENGLLPVLITIYKYNDETV